MTLSQIGAARMAVYSQSLSPLSGLAIKASSPVPSSPESLSMSDAKVDDAQISLDEQLFDNAAQLKVATAHVGMHLKPELRATIFKQLNRLLDFDNWQEDSAFIKRPSFTTFLRFVLHAETTRLPSLGVGANGNILAAWNSGGQQIAIQFFSNDEAAASFVIQGARSRESVAWRGHIADLKTFIERNGLADCIRKGCDG